MFAGMSTSVGQLLFWRCCTFVGVCVEFVAAVAWLAELFNDPEAARAGRRLHAGIRINRRLDGDRCVLSGRHVRAHVAADCAAVTRPGATRLLSGVIPAIPLILIRPFLPESPAWQLKKLAGTLKRPSFAELFRPAFSPHDDRHDHHDGVRVCRGVWRHPADAARRSRARTRCARCHARRRSRRSAACSRFRNSAASPAASFWRVSQR